MSLGGSSPPQDNTAQLKYAEISKQMYNDFKARYQPIVNNLISTVSDPNTIRNEAQQAGNLSGAGFDASMRATRMKLGDYGPVTADQNTYLTRIASLGHARAVASSENRARITGRDRQVQMLGSLAALGRGVQNNAVAGFSKGAGMENQRNQINQNLHTQAEQSDMQFVGQMAGLAVMGAIAA